MQIGTAFEHLCIKNRAVKFNLILIGMKLLNGIQWIRL